MNMKVIIGILAGLTLLVVAPLILTQQTQTQLAGTPFSQVSVATTTPYMKVEGSYPHFDGIDLGLETYISRLIAETDSTSRENDLAMVSFDPTFKVGEHNALSISASTTLNSAEFISVILTITGFTGGAHGFTYHRSFLHELRTQKNITFLEYLALNNFDTDSMQRAVRTQAGKEMLKRSEQTSLSDDDTAWLFNGTSATSSDSNYSATALTSPTTALVYLDPYQVAAYVYGGFEIPVVLK
jgi:peptidoglycan-N-acetylglucosamine deacetylase